MDRVGQALLHRQRWRRCRDLLEHVTFPDPFDVTVFVTQLGERRGRPIHLLPQPGVGMGDGPCGVWVATADQDVILVEPGVAPLHREHIVLHEVGHILCDHGRALGTPTSLAIRLLPHLDPALVRRVLGRTSYTTPEEQEAELVATMIGARITQRASQPAETAPSTGDVAAVLQRLSRVIGGPEH
jgi:hypothetical protein